MLVSHLDMHAARLCCHHVYANAIKTYAYVCKAPTSLLPDSLHLLVLNVSMVQNAWHHNLMYGHLSVQVWVITGDKQETAINIAISCKLIRHPDSLLICNADSPEAAGRRIAELTDQVTPQPNPSEPPSSL